MSVEDSREALVGRAKEGDRAAFETLVARSRERLEGWVRSHLGEPLREKVEVEDVLQETYLWAFQALPRLEWRGEERFEAWLRTIAKHAISRVSRDQARKPALSLEHEVPANGTSPSRHLRRHERFERLEKALEDLSPEHRKVILMARIEGLSVQEIAARMERTPDAVVQLLSRALRQLKRSFGETESFHLPERAFERQGGGAGGEKA